MCEFSAGVDVVILGTGLIESILAGALARVGKKVLHIDSNDFYGGKATSFTFDQILNWAEEKVEEKTNQKVEGKEETSLNPPKIPDDCSFVPIQDSHIGKRTFVNTYDQVCASFLKSNIVGKENASEVEEKSCGLENVAGVVKETREEEQSRILCELLQENRNFNIDLSPRLMLARGTMCNALVRSGVGRYLEFQVVDDAFVLLEDKAEDSDETCEMESRIANSALHQVPCGKGDVFKSRWLGLLEKRVLMKFLQFCVDFSTDGGVSEAKNRNEMLLGAGRSLTRPQNKQTEIYSKFDYENFKTRPFAEFLKTKFSLTPTLISIALHAIAFESHGNEGLNGETPINTEQGMQRIGRYLTSLGRFSRTAFLWTNYGAGEIPQAFARMCAVYGGTYMLREKIQGFVFHEKLNRFQGVVMSNGRCTKAGWIVTGREETPQFGRTIGWVHRFVAIVDGVVTPDSGKCLLVLPPNKAWGKAIRILQIDRHSMCVPKGKFLVYLSTTTNCESEGSLASKVLRDTLDALIKRAPREKDRILASAKAQGDAEKPNICSKILWSLSYRQQIVAPNKKEEKTNLIFCGDHDAGGVHFEDIVNSAKTLFKKICPDKEFLPEPPKEAAAAYHADSDDDFNY
eukprot:g1653.t1